MTAVLPEFSYKQQQPSLELIIGEGISSPDSRGLYEAYTSERIAAGFAEKAEGEELKAIQEDVRGWLTEQHPGLNEPGTVEDYSTYDIDTVDGKIGSLVRYLKENYSDKISDVELEATAAFIDSTFAMYEDREKGDSLIDRDGSFAFMVPMRMSRKYPQFGVEIEPIIPALRYVPNELRAWIMRGLPPFIADTYKSENGKRGYLVCVPSVTEDMRDDLFGVSAGTFVKTGREVVNTGVDFAVNRLGVNVVGLGATLPAITNFGDSVRKAFGDEVVVTTGHGGTVDLIKRQIESVANGRPVRIGVLGLGSIGASAAEIIAESFPDSEVRVYDTTDKKINGLIERVPGRFVRGVDEKDVIEGSDIIVSAIVAEKGVIDLGRLGIKSMVGKVVIDDSQPPAFSDTQIEAMGGHGIWVIGNDKNGVIRRMGYDYGTMLSPTDDLFGCEAEAGVLARLAQELESGGLEPKLVRKFIGNLAITGQVTAESAARIGELFDKYGIGVAPPQAHGRAVHFALAA